MLTIDAFVELETKVEGESSYLEMSTSSSIRDVVEKHLAATLRTTMGEQPDVTRVYGFKIGTRIGLQQSDWSVGFADQNAATLDGYTGPKYDRTFEVVDIEVQYMTQNLRQMRPTPLIVIEVTLRPC